MLVVVGTGSVWGGSVLYLVVLGYHGAILFCLFLVVVGQCGAELFGIGDTWSV